MHTDKKKKSKGGRISPNAHSLDYEQIGRGIEIFLLILSGLKDGRVESKFTRARRSLVGRIGAELKKLESLAHKSSINQAWATLAIDLQRAYVHVKECPHLTENELKEGYDNDFKRRLEWLMAADKDLSGSLEAKMEILRLSAVKIKELVKRRGSSGPQELAHRIVVQLGGPSKTTLDDCRKANFGSMMSTEVSSRRSQAPKIMDSEKSYVIEITRSFFKNVLLLDSAKVETLVMLIGPHL